MKVWTRHEIHYLQELLGRHVPIPEAVPAGDLYTDMQKYWLRVEDEMIGDDAVRWEKIPRSKAEEMIYAEFVKESYGAVLDEA